VLEERLTTDNHLNFLTLLMEDVLLETKRGIFFQHDEAPPHFGRKITAYLNQRYENRWMFRCGPVTWPLRSPEIAPLDLFYGV
jgi:hypothetical protein